MKTVSYVRRLDDGGSCHIALRLTPLERLVSLFFGGLHLHVWGIDTDEHTYQVTLSPIEPARPQSPINRAGRGT